ncbi:CBS domain-containing protein [Actinopolymorpha pittospori]
MAPCVLGVDATSGVDVALQMMVGAGVRHLPVMEENRCVGLLYEADVVWRMAGWSSLDRPPSASDLARKGVPLLTAGQTIREAAQELIRKAGDAVLVTDRDQVVGILTADHLVTLLRTDVPDEVPESPRPPTAATPSYHEGTVHDGQ